MYNEQVLKKNSISLILPEKNIVNWDKILDFILTNVNMYLTKLQFYIADSTPPPL